MIDVAVAPHPLLRTSAFAADYGRPLGQIASPPWLVDLLRIDAATPLQRSDELRAAVRDMLRYGGYKPTGRGKPASEYLVRTAEEGGIRAINVAVDVCNVVSLHSGLPISVVDHDLAQPPLHIAIAPGGSSYVFNPGGQEIDVSGLVCLFDAAGPCANAVKDSQRTKTNDGTMRTVTVIWGVAGFEAQLAAATGWYQELLQKLR